MLDAESAFQPRHPEAGLRQIDMIPAQGNCFRHPEPVPEHHQDQQVIAGAMPACPGTGKKLVDLSQTQIVPPALMRISGKFHITFDISPCGMGCAVP